MMVDALGASKALSLIYAAWLSYRVWRPPAGLASEEGTQSPRRPAPAGETTVDVFSQFNESNLSSATFRVLFAVGMCIMVATDVGIVAWKGTGFFHEQWRLRDVVALLAMAAGVKLREDAYAALGEFFTFKVSTVKGHRLVDTGPYRLLLHPGYSGLILQRMALTYFLGLKNDLVLYLLYTLLGVPGMTLRIMHEEQELRSHFGADKFDRFKSERYRLIPYVF